MERPVRTKFNTQIYEEACEWFIDCRAGDLDDVARVEFDRWLRKSPEHQSAYLEVAAIWNEGPTLDPVNRWSLDTLIAQAAEDPDNIIALDRSQRPSDNVSLPLSSKEAVTLSGEERETPETPRQAPDSPYSDGSVSPEDARETHRDRLAPGSHRAAPRSGRARLFAVAASILLVTGALAIYLLVPRGVYATTIGEQRSLALSDGSTVELNSLSKLRIRYSEHERTVYLLQGQALFHVAKDATRPFVVHSGETRVRAVGTQFDVYRKPTGTVITVVEGRVAILEDNPGNPGNPVPGTDRETDRKDQPNPVPGTGASDIQLPDRDGAIFLAAGEQMTVTPRAARRTPHPNLASATAWTQRQLVFDSASLTDVADEFNRYNERKLVIDPSAFGSLHISGVFSSTEPASLIRFLRDRPDLRVTEMPTEIRVEQDR
jgi:transmembrane sensor